MVCVDFEVDDYLDEASASALRREVNRRIAAGSWTVKPEDAPDGIEPWTPAGLAEDIRLAFYSRNASRLESLLVVLERREETPRHRLVPG